MGTGGGGSGKKACSPSLSTQVTAEQGLRAQIASPEILIGSPGAQHPALGAFPTSTQNTTGADCSSSSGHSPTTCSPALRAAQVFDEPRSVLCGWANFRGDMS